jgi:hypothetical protein
MVWKEANVAQFVMISQYLPGETEDYHECLSQGISRPVIEPSTFLVQVRKVTA